MKTIKNILQDWQDKRLRQKLMKRLLSIDNEYWPMLYSDFNGWRFPVQFYDLVPRWHTNYCGSERLHKLISDVCKKITQEIGEKKLLYNHNVSINGRKMTPAEFEYWFSIRGEEGYFKYYERSRKMEEIEFWKDDVFEKIEKLFKEP